MAGKPGARTVELPWHIRGNRDLTDPQHDGHFAQRAPDIYYEKERSVSLTRALLKRAIRALTGWQGTLIKKGRDGTEVNVTALGDLRDAFESLDAIIRYLPKVHAWCVWTTYNDGWSDEEVIWSGHTTEAEALKWLPVWKAKLGRRTDYDWHVSIHECVIRDVMEPGADPLKVIGPPWAHALESERVKT